MQIFVKTLKGTHFEIEVKPDDTVSDVKKNIETSQGQSVYPADQQMLIHQGKVLKDETTLAENNVEEKSFVVVMLKKGKGSSSGASTTIATPTSKPPPASTVPVNRPAPSSAPATIPTPVLESTPPTAAAAPAPAVTAPVPAVTAPVPAVTAPVPSVTTPALAVTEPAPTVTEPAPAVTEPNLADAYDQAASNLVAGNNLEQAIQQIVDMGGGTWDRDTVVRAMRAAFNNPERAVDYLYSGIPEQAEIPPVAQSPAAVQTTPNSPVQAPQPAQPVVPSSGPNANPLDLFPQGLPSMGSNPGAGSLDFLRNSPQFRALQAMVQANPQILQPMLQELGRQNPQIMRLIQDHQTEFLRLINEPAEGGESNLLGQLAASMPQALTVTPEEHEAIERLEAMGFNRALVLEVFFACNKNEELAANYLLDHMHEFDE